MKTPLGRLARLYGVQTSYIGLGKKRKDASPEALLSVLAALGAPVRKMDDVPKALETKEKELKFGVQPVVVAWDGRLDRKTARKFGKLPKDLPAGYSVVIGGSVEESAKSQAPILAVVPLMLFVMATVLMIQLQSFHRLFLVFAVAPLAVIGVVMAMLPSGSPLGFVAILGVLALIGILVRNSVILIVQIEDLRKEGRPAWDAVVEATEHRMRPILLTAAAASLALIPIAREIFWGPMAYAMMGGIIVGTLLTLLFLPALYVAWFRIHPVQDHDRPMPEAVDSTQHPPSSERLSAQNEPAPVLETQF